MPVSRDCAEDQAGLRPQDEGFPYPAERPDTHLCFRVAQDGSLLWQLHLGHRAAHHALHHHDGRHCGGRRQSGG